MEENIVGEHSISTTDSESRHIPEKRYNGIKLQYLTVTDNKYGFRLEQYITNNTNNQKEVKKLADIIKERIHTDNFILCVDNGY